MEVVVAAGEVLLHQREPDPLRDAALDLALDQRRVDRAADVVRGRDALEELTVPRCSTSSSTMFRRTRSRVRLPLPSSSSAVVGGSYLAAADRTTVLVLANRVEVHLRDSSRGCTTRGEVRRRSNWPLVDASRRARAADAERRPRQPHRRSRRRTSASMPISSPRPAWCPYRPCSVSPRHVHAYGIGQICVITVLAPGRCRPRPDGARCGRRGGCQSDRRRVRQRRVPAAVPHAGHSDAAAGLAAIGVRPAVAPGRAPNAESAPPGSRDTRSPIEHLTGDRRDARRERVEVAELEPINAHGIRELIEQAFLRDRRLWHAEPRNAPDGGPFVWMATVRARYAS